MFLLQVSKKNIFYFYSLIAFTRQYKNECWSNILAVVLNFTDVKAHPAHNMKISPIVQAVERKFCA